MVNLIKYLFITRIKIKNFDQIKVKLIYNKRKFMYKYEGVLILKID
jgi:hypothetical protein